MRIRRARLSFRVVALAFLLAGVATPLPAQTTVTVSGVVTDGENQPIAGCTVEFLWTALPVASAVTDADGRYSVQVTPNTYDIRVVPPAGSVLPPSFLMGRTITEDTTLNVILVAPVMRRLTGRVLDGSDAGVAGASITLASTSGSWVSYQAVTDSSGAYALDIPSGTYRLEMTSTNPQLEAGRPQFARAMIWQVTLDADRVLDLALPLHRVDVHVQDVTGNPVAAVGLSASAMDYCGVTFSGLPGCIGSSYTYSTMPPIPGMPASENPLTDASGNFTMWLAVTGPIGPGTMGYTFTATPPPASGLPATAVPGIAVAGDTSVTITLQSALTLSGRVVDDENVPFGGATIWLSSNQPGIPALSTTTAADGSYAVQASPGSYRLELTSSNGELLPGRPQFLRATIWNVPLEASRVLDLVLPLHRVDVHVQDEAGAAAAQVGLGASGADNCDIQASALPVCLSSSYFYSSMPPFPGIPAPPQPITDADGNYTMWLTPSGLAGPAAPGYTFTATPPPGSPLPATSIPGIAIAGDMPLTITLRAPVQLAGRITDAAGAPVAGAWVTLQTTGGGWLGTSTTSDADGVYRFDTSPGTYQLTMTFWNGQLAPNRPQSATVRIAGLVLDSTRTLDLPLPLLPVQVHARDIAGGPVAGVGLSAFSWDNCEIQFSGLSACVRSEYYYYPPPPPDPMMPPPPPQPMTDASGNFTMWLFPTGAPGPAAPGYTLNATPGAGTPFQPVSVPGNMVTEPTEILVTLPFVHGSPVSAATLSPAPDWTNRYPDPVSVALSSTAVLGFSIARIEYQIDGGAVHTYAGPFTVTGGGAHELRFWATDDSGVYEVPQTVPFTIRGIPTIAELGETLAHFCVAGDIDEAGLCNSLDVKLREGAPLQAFLNELDAQRGKHVSEDAYARLAADVRRLITGQ